MQPDETERLAALERRLGYSFTDRGLLAGALRHSSWVHENPGEGPSNERLEFLGDAVLELVITQFLYENFPDAPEGQLSKARSGVVNEAHLAATARLLGLGEHMRLGRGEINQQGYDKPSILADAMEAVAAAVYLDGGLEAARAFLLGLLSSVASESIQRAPRKDYKTRLQELVQEALHLTPIYTLAGAEGPDHDKTFRVVLTIDGANVATGWGKSKKEAEQDAARQGLARWMQDHPSPEC